MPLSASSRQGHPELPRRDPNRTGRRLKPDDAVPAYVAPAREPAEDEDEEAW